MKLRPLLLTVSSAFAFTVPSGAAVLADWTFTGNNPADHTENENASGVVVADAATYVTTLAGVTSTDLVGSGTALFSNGTAGGAPVYQNEINVRGFGNATGGYEFTLTPTSGTINITGISIDLWRNGAGAPDTMIFEANVDGGGFAAFGSSSVESNTGDEVFRTHNFSGDITGSSIVLRFTASNNTGNIHINDIQVTGDFDCRS